MFSTLGAVERLRVRFVLFLVMPTGGTLDKLDSICHSSSFQFSGIAAPHAPDTAQRGAGLGIGAGVSYFIFYYKKP